MPFEVPAPVLELLRNDIVKNESKQGWGRLVSTANEWVQEAMLNSLGYNANMVHGESFDILVNESVRVQSKMRQVSGNCPWSKAVYLETTRRHSTKNIGADLNGHIAYSRDEFDFIFVTLVWDQESRSNPNTWYYSLIPTHALIDPHNPRCLVTSISPDILHRYRVSRDPLGLL
jgi:hypothetical protein